MTVEDRSGSAASSNKPTPSAAPRGMTNTNITTVQDIYAAFGRGDVTTILDLVTDDVDWASEPEGSALWHGIHRGGPPPIAAARQPALSASTTQTLVPSSDMPVPSRR